jgi:hypothetical protein
MHRLGIALPIRFASPVCEAFLFRNQIMTKSFNRTAVYAVFNDADNESASFAVRLMELGIASRAEAKPFAMDWASKKHNNEPIKMGQRGMTFVRRDTNAEKAMNRVLQVCYPSADAPKPKTGKRTANKVDPVSALFKKWQALSASEKRRFTTMQLKA